METKLRARVEQLISLALEEDLGTVGDLTTDALVPAEREARAVFLAKSDLIVCGQELAELVFQRLDPASRYKAICLDGERVRAGTEIAEVNAKLRAILSGERTALNFMQRLSGIATKTRFVTDQVAEFPVTILDTRKTTPGYRVLEKYAVKCGGGTNHREGLFDVVMIKNNHVDACGGDIVEAVKLCREYSPAGTKIEVEVRSIAELELALQTAPDYILLDNMSPELTRQAVQITRSRSKAKLESSGGITEQTLLEYAATGVDAISLGALTHTVQAADIALRFRG